MKWTRKTNITAQEIKKLAQELDRDELIIKILLNRGFTNEQIRITLNDWHEAILPPRELTNALEAANLITEYLKNPNAEIWIYGDYDVDGITSTYIMSEALKEVANCSVNGFYPNRNEGYGLSMRFCENLVELKRDKDILVITVDNGITKIEEVKYLKEHNIEVLITDHHVAKETVPDCLIVDPHNNNEPDTFKHLCGASVAFKVAQLVQENFNVNNMINYVYAVAIATVTDMMPLNHPENFAFLNYGLTHMNSKECPPGIKAFKEFSGKDILTSTDIGWELGPRLNSCGRLNQTEFASILFTETDKEALDDYIIELEQMNAKRKSYSDKAKKMIKKLNFDNDKVCVIKSNDYPEGVIGIIAGEVQKKFNKPALVLHEKDGMLVGSARTANGVNLQKLFSFEESKGNIVSFGGHAAAAGIQVNANKLDDLKASFNKNIEQFIIDEYDVEQELFIDEIINLQHLNRSTFNLLSVIPFDNTTLPTPVFSLVNVNIIKEPKYSKNNPNNICFFIEDDKGTKASLWAWGMADKYKELGSPKKMHIAGNLTRNFLRPGTFTLKIIDFISA